MNDYNQVAEVFLQRLKTEIPLVNHMGLSPLNWNGDKLEMTASLAPNINDKGTGFGGSLATLATLCGWSIVTLALNARGRNDDVVIRDSHIEYFHPITSDFTAKASLPGEGKLNLFFQKMDRKGRASMDLIIEIKQDNKVAMRLTGRYVALEKKP